MFQPDFIYLVGLIVLAIAAYIDIKTREVPDLLNYGLIFFAMAIRLIYSIADNDWMILLQGILGGAIGFALGSAMYYAGQWGGGDTKLLAGMGLLIGLPFSLSLSFFPVFFIFIFFAGAAFALFYSIYLAAKNWKSFAIEFKKTNESLFKVKIGIFIFLLVLLGLTFFIKENEFRLTIFSLAIVIVLMMYLFAIIKAVEKSAMIKSYSVSKLSEGDWIYKDVYVKINSKNKLMCGPKDLGISAKQIEQLKKLKVKKVLVKEGMAFVPSFFIAYVATPFLMDWFLSYFRILFG